MLSLVVIVKRLAPFLLAGTLILPKPALAFFGPMPVIDPTAISKIVQQIVQAEQLVNAAKTNLSTLPGAAGISTITSRISGITQILQQARTVCLSAQAGITSSSACQVQAATATAQAASFAQDATDLDALESLARGSAGNLQAQQTNALAVLAEARQILSQRQAQTSAVLQKQIDTDALRGALKGNSAGDPSR